MNYVFSVKYTKAEMSGLFSSVYCGQWYRPLSFACCSGSALVFLFLEC